MMALHTRGKRRRRGGVLAVWTNGSLVGHWHLSGSEHRFQYAPAWRASLAARRLSLSLPFTPGNVPHRGEVVRNFFDNLLPDSELIRQRLQERFGAASTDAFDLLAAGGRDCAGSLQLLPVGAEPSGWADIGAQPLDAAGIERHIDSALSADDDGMRLLLSGHRDKTALLWHRGRWCRPGDATPTTHIFKLAPDLLGADTGDTVSAIDNEWLCARILQALGLPVARSEVAVFGRRKVLVVERFDRTPTTDANGRPWLARLPQEDLCQALGLPRMLKYEADGGPGVAAVLRVLSTGSNAEADRQTFVLALLAFWLLAAVEGHAKNFSLHLERSGRYRLTPLYGVRSAWPGIGDEPGQMPLKQARMAMALGADTPRYRLADIRTRHWQALAQQADVPFAPLVELVHGVPAALDAVQAQLPLGFSARLWRPVQAGMLAQALRFAAGLA